MSARAGVALSRRTMRVLTSLLVVAALAVGVAPPVTAERSLLGEYAAAASYIVMLHPGVDVRGVLGNHGVSRASVTARYRGALNGFAATIREAAAARLATDARVVRVERDRVMRIAATQTSPPWGVDRSDQRSLPLSKTYTYGTTGKGVTVYVLDTGVRATHADFGGRVAGGYNATNYVDPATPSPCPAPGDPASTDDDDGHGTHVAGTIGGSYFGIAKAVTVVPVKVLDCEGRGWISHVIDGIDWMVGHHATGTPAVANMSLGVRDPDKELSVVDLAVANAITDGVTLVTAAGNDGDDACDHSPARVREAVTVAASNEGDRRPKWSNYGACLDLFGPGVDILSAGNANDQDAASASGTSMAAPHVAGAAARYLQSRPSASPATVAKALLADATEGVISRTGAKSPNLLLYAKRATSLSIATSKRRITYGDAVTVKGRLVTSDGAGVAHRTVKLQRRRAGTTKWVNLTDMTTSATGRVSHTYAPVRTFAYRYVHRRSADYASSRSPARTVGVRTHVTATLSSATVDRGARAILRGAVRPGHAGRRVVLQRYRGGAWRKVASASLTKRSRYRFRLPTASSGKIAYRVVKPADLDHLRGVTPKRVLTVR
ncbi:MAG: S8 family serine peptidase [Nitriliruptorales bacterium]|nr:S8 family serine peptidase [Nitriliruptorales bacterium]